MGDFWSPTAIAQGLSLTVDAVIFGLVYRAYRQYSNNIKALEVSTTHDILALHDAFSDAKSCISFKESQPIT